MGPERLFIDGAWVAAGVPRAWWGGWAEGGEGSGELVVEELGRLVWREAGPWDGEGLEGRRQEAGGLGPWTGCPRDQGCLKPGSPPPGAEDVPVDPRGLGLGP